MSDFSRIVDDQIQKAFADGEFDNLPGSGKPLKLDVNPYEDPEWRAAFHALESSGYSLIWITMGQDIAHRLEKEREIIMRTLNWIANDRLEYLTGLDKSQELQIVKDQYQKRIMEINKLIFDYNLKVPLSQLQMPMNDIENDILNFAIQESG